MLTAIVAILVFGLLIAFHELGHFGVAKLVGVKVHEFAIGMGPKIVDFTRGETKYTLRLLPIGGYVKMEGEDEASDDKRSFNNKSVYARAAILVAGAMMNFILAIILFSILSYSIGFPITTIDSTMPDSPAEHAGLQSGDKIVEINNNEIKDWNELVSVISDSKGEKLTVVFLRGESRMTKTIQPFVEEETKRIMIGIVPSLEKALLPAIGHGFTSVWRIIGEMGNFLRQLVTGQARDADVVGPIGIITLVGEAARAGWLNVVFLAAMISINLGLINLLPIPALDGSRILFLLVELVRGKPIDPEKEGRIHFLGFVILISLMLFVTYKDILRLFN